MGSGISKPPMEVYDEMHEFFTFSKEEMDRILGVSPRFNFPVLTSTPPSISVPFPTMPPVGYVIKTGRTIGKSMTAVSQQPPSWPFPVTAAFHPIVSMDEETADSPSIVASSSSDQHERS